MSSNLCNIASSTSFHPSPFVLHLSFPWLPDTVSRATYSEQKYVRVTGIVKAFGNKKYINANAIRPITDMHELYFHLMEAMFVTLAHQRGPVSAFLTYLCLPSFLTPTSLQNPVKRPAPPPPTAAPRTTPPTPPTARPPPRHPRHLRRR